MKPLALSLALFALASLSAPLAAQDLAFRGWGIRGGISDDPDQVVGGLQLNLGEFVPNLRFQPNVEFAAGDDIQILSLGAPVHYRFPVDRDFTVYGGGGLALAAIDRDEPRPGEDDSDFEISPILVGGLEWPAASGDLFAELTASGGDLPTVKLILGWMF